MFCLHVLWILLIVNFLNIRLLRVLPYVVGLVRPPIAWNGGLFGILLLLAEWYFRQRVIRIAIGSNADTLRLFLLSDRVPSYYLGLCLINRSVGLFWWQTDVIYWRKFCLLENFVKVSFDEFAHVIDLTFWHIMRSFSFTGLRGISRLVIITGF